MKDFVILIGIMVLSMVVGLYPAYVAFDIARLFEVPWLGELRYAQFYGLILVYNLVNLKLKRKDNTKTLDEIVDETGIGLVKRVVGSTIIWGLAYVIHLVVN